jgi:hypothetical protein
MAKGNLLQSPLNPVAKEDVEQLYGPGEGLRAGAKPLYLRQQKRGSRDWGYPRVSCWRAIPSV